MSVKEELHQLIEQLDESSAQETLDYIRWFQLSHDSLTPEEWEQVRRGEAQIARGGYITLDDLVRELGLASKPRESR